jgi:hypothetical protein
MPPQPGLGAERGPADSGKRMVGKVISGNGITRHGNGAYSLIGDEAVSDGERGESECRA